MGRGPRSDLLEGTSLSWWVTKVHSLSNSASSALSPKLVSPTCRVPTTPRNSWPYTSAISVLHSWVLFGLPLSSPCSLHGSPPCRWENLLSTCRFISSLLPTAMFYILGTLFSQATLRMHVGAGRRFQGSDNLHGCVCAVEVPVPLADITPKGMWTASRSGVFSVTRV